MALFDDARWARYLGTCRCGKQATAELMNSRNDVLAKVCTRCANVLIKAAERDRNKKVSLA